MGLVPRDCALLKLRAYVLLTKRGLDEDHRFRLPLEQPKQTEFGRPLRDLDMHEPQRGLKAPFPDPWRE